jgi:O-antigen ligase
MAIVALIVVFWNAREDEQTDSRSLLYFLGAWTGLMVLQLVPMPPALWTALPGRDLLAHFYDIMDQRRPWRPLSLEPHLTANSLFAMVVPWAVFLLMTAKLRRDEPLVETVLAAFLLVSMAIGALQMASGGRSLYFYAITNLGSPVGLFSNRNHNAFVAVMLVPLLTRLIIRRSAGRPLAPSALFMLGSVAFAVLIDILVIGSRMGLLLFILSITASWGLLQRHRGERRQAKALRPDKSRTFLLLGGIGAILAAVLTVVIVYREQFVAVSRLTDSGTEDERLAYLPWVVNLVEQYFPFGSGFGTFPTVFKVVEPDELLRLAYLNHAHNDVVEIWVEGGIFAGAIACAFVALWLARTVSVWRRQTHDGADDWQMQARLGSVFSGLLLIGSATDYPLRTPACAATFVIGAYWLLRRRPPKVP